MQKGCKSTKGNGKGSILLLKNLKSYSSIECYVEFHLKVNAFIIVDRAPTRLKIQVHIFYRCSETYIKQRGSRFLVDIIT